MPPCSLSSYPKLSQTSESTERKRLTESIERLKTAGAALKIQEQGRQDAFDQAQQELRNSQEALENTEDQVNTLAKKFDSKRE